MKHLTLILTVAAMATALAACNKTPAESATPAAQPAPAPAADSAMPDNAMPGMDMAGMDMAGATVAKGTGTVTAIDKAGGMITLDHGPIDAVKWPAMTMEFKVTPATLLDTVKVGDKVSFEMKVTDGVGEVTAVQAR